MKQEILDKIRLYRADPRIFIEQFFHIETTAERIRGLLQRDISPIRGSIYPFYFSEDQKILYQHFIRQRRQRRPVRLIILKSRQQCSSTLWAAILFAEAILNPNVKGLLLANLEHIGREIFSKINLFYSDLPKMLQPTIKLSEKRNLVFDNKEGTGLRSQIRVEVSANTDAGAGTSLTHFLGSEVARWFFPEKLMQSLMPGISKSANSMVVLESTARGYGNYFHLQYLDAKEGRTDFEAVFLPWFICKYYAKPLDTKWFDIPLDSEERYQPERELKARYSLTDEQLYWRRNTIDNECQGDPLKFIQEYPSNDIEAFISADMNVFNIRKLQELACRSYCHKGEKGDIRDNRFIPAYDGYWEIWEAPQPGVSYIFGVDSGTGIVGGDPNATVVLRADTLDQVAELHCHTDASTYSTAIVEGAKYYNNAFVIIEINGTSGGAVLERVKDKYYNLYLWETIDKFGKVVTNRLGWVTGRFTKPLLIQDARDYINQDLGKIRSPALIAELMSYLEHANGTIGAATGCYDDRAMAFMLCLRAYNSHQRRWESALKPNIAPTHVYEYNEATQTLTVPYRPRYQQGIEQINITPYGIY